MPFEAGLNDLYQQVLTWDLHDLLDGLPLHHLVKLPATFSSPDAYIDAFEPLLLEEARAQLERARQDERIRTHKLRLLELERRGPFYQAILPKHR